MIKHFLIFASSDLSQSLKRIRSEAVNMSVYDEIAAIDESVFDKVFKRQFKRFKLGEEFRGLRRSYKRVLEYTQGRVC